MLAVEVLFQSIVDYAGTFPPARLDLADALSHYARARVGAQAWLLGRFVLPAERLEDFERLAETAVAADSGQPGWPLSLIVKGSSLGDRESDFGIRIERFNRRWQGRAAIVALEFGPLDVAQIDRTARMLPRDFEAFFEVPLGGGHRTELDARIAVIARHGALAKVRTGGIVPDAFPSATELVRFMASCVAARVAFKATAGLHHAMRGQRPLTDETDSPSVEMHGFLNVCVAAALVRLGDAPAAIQALQETSAPAFSFELNHMRWQDRSLTAAELADTRRHVFRSFGSCAFGEPVEELRRLGLL